MLFILVARVFLVDLISSVLFPFYFYCWFSSKVRHERIVFSLAAYRVEHISFHVSRTPQIKYVQIALG